MFVIGPIWFILLMLLIFGWQSKEERWLADKQKQAIRELMEEERRLMKEQNPEERRWILSLIIVALIVIAIIANIF